MIKRIVASVILLPLLLLVLLAAHKICTAFLFAALAAIAAFELLWSTGLVKEIRLVVYTVVIAALVPIWSHFGCDQTLAQAGILAFFLLLFMEMMISHAKLDFRKIAVCITGGLLIPYMMASLVRITVFDSGRLLILIPFVIAFMSDSGAYFVGCAIGKHKMAPVISPKKSWEGFLGGLITAILGMILYAWILAVCFQGQVNYIFAGIYGLLGALGGVFGDLCFSVIKRQTGIKDYGNLIPGHGGVLDRFDSILVVAPLVELLLQWMPMVVNYG